MISARIVLDTFNRGGERITTLQLMYPRFIHGEFMTHRVFSRNSMSSRAVPIAKMIQQVRMNPALTIHWGANEPGMQANAEVSHAMKKTAETTFMHAAANMADFAEMANMLGLHKQVVNRLLEPFQWMHTICTATDWDNFFELRIHKDAEPNMCQLATVMKQAMDESIPVTSDVHEPYLTTIEREQITDHKLRAELSAARCARVSYLNHDGCDPVQSKDLELARRLLSSKHLSPFEHVAWEEPFTRCANYQGWQSYRRVLGY